VIDRFTILISLEAFRDVDKVRGLVGMRSKALKEGIGERKLE
jgi:hypothetical protein